MGTGWECHEREAVRAIAPGAEVPSGPAWDVWLLLGGIALSCTGIGAVVGVPLCVIALVARARSTPERGTVVPELVERKRAVSGIRAGRG